MNPKVSIYNGVTDTKGVVVSVDKVIERIRSGGRDLDEKTKLLAVLSQTDKDAYTREKLKLPAVAWSGTFAKRKASDLVQHSGLICLDYDHIDVGGLLADISVDPHVLCAFVSPSGAGVKAIVPFEPIPSNAEEHKIAFASVNAHFEQYGEIDESGSDVSRLCFLAHDPRALLNPDAKALTGSLAGAVHGENGLERANPLTRQTAPATPDKRCPSLEEAEQILCFIDPLTLDYENWRNVGMAIKDVGLPISVWQNWCNGRRKRSTGEVVTEDCQAHWDRFNASGITWGSVIHLAKENGYEPARTSFRRPVKLQKHVVSMLTETLQKSRDFLKSVFEQKKIKFFGLRADTGVGKNEAAIAFYIRGFSGVLNVPTTDLAIETEARLNAAEVNSCFRYRGILSNPDGEFPDEKPCIHAARYDAIASRGWNAYALLCESCEVRGLCEERGYRSQAEKAKQAQVTVMPFPDIFLNPAFRTLAKDYLPTYADDLILTDEFDPFNFLEINLPKSRLVQMRDGWKGYDPSQFAKEILRILEVEGDVSQLRTLIGELSDVERANVVEGLTCVMWRGQILSREDAHRCHEFITAARSLETISNLPRLETEAWNLLVQLELFFERYPRDTDMPMTYEKDILTFYLPPMPLYTRARMGFMSAMLEETLFRRCFDTRQEKRGDVSFHSTGLTAWHPEAKVYQLRTNRNPRATAFNPKGERVDGDLLSPTGDFYFGLVSDDLKKPNRGLITYKALLEALEKEGGICPGVQTANFGGLVGLDTQFKDVDVLHVLFSPELPPSAVEFKAKMMFGNDTEPLCYDRDENGNYSDERLQQCYDAGVISELLQAIGRGRLVSKPMKVVVWCSHFLPGLTDRPQCYLFDEMDWQQADGDIEKLGEVIASREASEKSGDAKAYAEATGQSERTGYRQTAAPRQQRDAERDAEILRMHNEGRSQRAIEREMKAAGFEKVSRKVIKTVIDEVVQN